MPAGLRKLLQILATPLHRSLRRGNALDYKFRDLCLSPGSATLSPDLPKPFGPQSPPQRGWNR